MQVQQMLPRNRLSDIELGARSGRDDRLPTGTVTLTPDGELDDEGMVDGSSVGDGQALKSRKGPLLGATGRSSAAPVEERRGPTK